MAREKADREDLLREATAFVERVEISLVEHKPIVVGFRRDGSLSCYLNPDMVYQFNARGELRRAFVAGVLYKADRGRLARLDRRETATAVELVRAELTEPQTVEFLQLMQRQLGELRAALLSGSYRLIGQVPSEGNVLARVVEWLAVDTPRTIAASPRVG